jgi:hypothetical protein
MALNVIETCRFFGPALPEPFVKFDLEQELSKLNVLSKMSGAEGNALEESWRVYQRKLRELATRGGALRVRNHVIEPLVQRLGYARIEEVSEVATREGRENGGMLLMAANGQAKLRVWATAFEEDLDAPAKRGAAYRYSHLRIAQRVLLACGERAGLLTNGVELRILISDPARPDSQIVIPIDPEWKMSRGVPDSYRLLLALGCPDGVKAIPDLVEKARLKQSTVTKELRRQAREAIGGFVQEVLDHPANREPLATYVNRDRLARQLWREGLILVYRLLFILKLESTDDSARSFSFASTSLWRNTFSPSTALAAYARKVIDLGAETGGLLEAGLRKLFDLFSGGLQCTELNVAPLGGALFGEEVTPVLTQCSWGERAAAHLLDQLLWTSPKRGSTARERVHYGTLDVEDLGRVYEALLELEPGIAAEPMCRLRRQKLEVVVPVAQGEKYKPEGPAAPTDPPDSSDPSDPTDQSDPADDDTDAPTRGKKTKVEWIEAIPAGRFYLRVGLGRKATGSYYTPHSFVRFLVQETLGPQVAERSPQDNPNPLEILKLKVLDPAMGSGHFLVEACRFLGEKLYEACRLCDELAIAAEQKAEKSKNEKAKNGDCTKRAERDGTVPAFRALEAEARAWRQRVIDLPDPDDELLRYLPSRAPEGEESGYSQRKAEALCRRLIAVHCLYGVDKNPLAVALAKLSLWIESHAEGLPLTFLDHRLVVGDSIAGPFFEHLLKYPGSQKPLDDLFTQGLREQLTRTLAEALRHIRDLEATVGGTLAEMEQKQQAKARLDAALKPFRLLAAAWAGGVMLGKDGCDDSAYAQLAQQVATGATPAPDTFHGTRLGEMIALGLDMNHAGHFDETNAEPAPALSFDLTFPEVFFPGVTPYDRRGFQAALGNPPWDKIRLETREILSTLDPEMLVGKEHARSATDAELVDAAAEQYEEIARRRMYVSRVKAMIPCLCPSLSRDPGHAQSDPDLYQLLLLLSADRLDAYGRLGMLAGGGLVKNPADAKTRIALSRAGSWHAVYHFINTRRLFPDLPTVIEFSVCVWLKGLGQDTRLAFNLEDDGLLLSMKEKLGIEIDASDLRQGILSKGVFPSAGRILTTQDSLSVDLSAWLKSHCLQLTSDLHRTGAEEALIHIQEVTDNCVDARKPEHTPLLLASGFMAAYSGKSIRQFDDNPTGRAGKWDPRVDLVASMVHPACSGVLTRTQYYRLALRATCGSPKTNARSVTACILGPACVATNSILLEGQPLNRPNSFALIAVGLLNTFTLDSFARPLISANFNDGIMKQVRVPALSDSSEPFLAHQGLRLITNSVRFAPLWREQLGDGWREPKPAFTWPVLEGDDARWAVRAAIDAVVADAYGLDGDQYAHVLSTFSHKSYPNAPTLCLARFDELKQIGLDAFTKKHDPYWDIPPNENLPPPVIELPAISGQQSAVSGQRGAVSGRKKRAGDGQMELE